MQDVLSIPSVTGVDLNLRIAGPGARSYAFIIDWHIRLLGALAWLVIGMIALFGSLDVSQSDPGASFMYIAVLPSAAIYFLYHPIVELIMGGRTPGKRIAGVRIVRMDGSVPGVGAILIRNVFRLIDSLPIAYCVGLAFTVLTERQVRIGDIAAGTLLVYDEATDKALEPFSRDSLGRLGMEQLELVRDLLERWPSLKPETRQSLARKLLTRLGELPQNDTDEDLREALDWLLRQPSRA